MTKPLFDNLTQIDQRLHNSEHTLLFLDYDGTLIPFQNHPHQVTTPPDLHQLLTKIQAHPRYQIAIITGRTHEEIHHLLPINGLIYAALHGLHITIPPHHQYTWEIPNKQHQRITAIKKQAILTFENNPAITIEDKHASVAFHYRRLPEKDIPKHTQYFLRLVHTIDPQHTLNIIHGSKVIEIRPTGWHKGNAVHYIRSHHNTPSLPIYIGDDTTDEDAFSTLKQTGMTIHVQNHQQRPTHAHYYVENPQQVHKFLQHLHSLYSR